MNTRSESSKLIELRAKTDRQLAEYIANRLDAGLTFARMATDTDVRTRWASTDLFHVRARDAYAEAGRLLPLVPSRNLRGALEVKREQLRVLIDGLTRSTLCARCAS